MHKMNHMADIFIRGSYCILIDVLTSQGSFLELNGRTDVNSKRLTAYVKYTNTQIKAIHQES